MMDNTRPKRRVRQHQCKWEVRVERPLSGLVTEPRLPELLAVAEDLGDTEARMMLTTFRAVATSIDGEELLASGATREEAIRNAVREIEMITGYSERDLQIDIQ
jgi:hypothetical protein